MAEQKRLQKRLQKFRLTHKLDPRTTVDTMTVADNIVSALDKLYEVRLDGASSHHQQIPSTT